MLRPLVSSLLIAVVAVGACVWPPQEPVFLDDVTDPPDDPGSVSPPTEPPPTGQRWEAVESEGCGRLTVTWVLVDDACGGFGSAGYLAGFRAPMFRDGAQIGDTLFVVDATHLWALDVADPAAVRRLALATGFGLPLAVDVHAGRLLLAAGDEGLIIVDVTDPAAPARQATVPLPGPALDVAVDGDLAVVAVGDAGLAVVDLVDLTFTKAPVPGFTVAALARDGRAYVAACDTFAVIDLATGGLLGQTWVAEPWVADRLVAPARSVELVDKVAFVAAGRYGAVAIDVGDPATPAVLGHCTVDSDLTFYASGVRAAGGRLYVAGGEWGIETVEVVDPVTACVSDTPPALPPEPASLDEGCTGDPPWTVVDWVASWVGPSLSWETPDFGKDPVQTLPWEDRLYAFGDARRIGVRSVDIRTATAELSPIGRYQEPLLVEDVAARDDRVLVAGPGGGLFLRDDAALLVPVEEPPPAVREACAAVLLDDGRWALGTAEGLVHIEGVADPFGLGERIWPRTLASHGASLLVPRRDAVVALSTADDDPVEHPLSRPAELPAVAVGDGEHLVVAAPEWTAALRLEAGGTSDAAPHDVFDEEGVLDLARWVERVPRRLLVSGEAGVLEVASLGNQAGLVLHGATPLRLALPPGTYLGAALDGDLAYLASADRALYRSQVLVVQLGAAPAVLSIHSFSGVAAGLLASDAAGNITGHAFTLRLDGTPPDVAFLSPAEGATVTGAFTVEVSATDPGDGPTWICLSAGGTAVAGGLGPLAAFDLDAADFPAGALELSATAQDEAGNESPPVVLTVDAAP